MGLNSHNKVHIEIDHDDEFEIDDVDLSALELDTSYSSTVPSKQNNITVTTHSYDRKEFINRFSNRRFLCKEIDIGDDINSYNNSNISNSSDYIVTENNKYTNNKMFKINMKYNKENDHNDHNDHNAFNTITSENTKLNTFYHYVKKKYYT